jgi:hypothetical protein
LENLELSHSTPGNIPEIQLSLWRKIHDFFTIKLENRFNQRFLLRFFALAYLPVPIVTTIMILLGQNPCTDPVSGYFTWFWGTVGIVPLLYYAIKHLVARYPKIRRSGTSDAFFLSRQYVWLTFGCFLPGLFGSTFAILLKAGDVGNLIMLFALLEGSIICFGVPAYLAVKTMQRVPLSSSGGRESSDNNSVIGESTELRITFLSCTKVDTFDHYLGRYLISQNLTALQRAFYLLKAIDEFKASPDQALCAGRAFMLYQKYLMPGGYLAVDFGEIHQIATEKNRKRNENSAQGLLEIVAQIRKDAASLVNDQTDLGAITQNFFEGLEDILSETLDPHFAKFLQSEWGKQFKTDNATFFIPV